VAPSLARVRTIGSPSRFGSSQTSSRRLLTLPSMNGGTFTAIAGKECRAIDKTSRHDKSRKPGFESRFHQSLNL
jgi:hypothetical protein